MKEKAQLSTVKVIALLLAVAMFLFSLWMYSRSGDWVALVFAIGSAAYAVYFFNSARGPRA